MLTYYVIEEYGVFETKSIYFPTMTLKFFSVSCCSLYIVSKLSGLTATGISIVYRCASRSVRVTAVADPGACGRNPSPADYDKQKCIITVKFTTETQFKKPVFMAMR